MPGIAEAVDDMDDLDGPRTKNFSQAEQKKFLFLDIIISEVYNESIV